METKAYTDCDGYTTCPNFVLVNKAKKQTFVLRIYKNFKTGDNLGTPTPGLTKDMPCTSTFYPHV